MSRARTACLVLLSLGTWASAAGPEPAPVPAGPVSFYKQVKPILQRHCQGCHQPAKAANELIMTNYAAFKKGGTEGPGFVPGKAEESLTYQYIAGLKKPVMPKNEPPLPPRDVEIIKQWITEGGRDDTPSRALDEYGPDHPPTYQAPPVTTALAFSPDGTTLAVSGYHEVLLHKADGSGLTGRLVGLSQRIESVTYSPDAKLLAVVGGSPGRFGEVQFWQVPEGKLVRTVQSTFDTQFGGSFSPDGKLFAFGTVDNSSRVITVADGKQLLKLDHHSDWCLATAFTLDNKHLVTLGRDRAVKLTAIEGGSFIDNVNKLLGELRCLARHPKKDEMVCAGEDGIPRLYQIFRPADKPRVMMDEDRLLIREFEKQPGTVSSLAFSPDGQLLAVGGVGGARLYRVADGQRVAILSGGRGAVHALAFHPSGTRLATGGFDGQVRLYDTANGNLVKTFTSVPLTK